jgi:hypothetical protein
MEIIYGKKPQKPLPLAGSAPKYQPIWDALASGNIAEDDWLAVKSSDVNAGTPKAKVYGLTCSAKKALGRKIQVMIEGDLLFIRFLECEVWVYPSRAPGFTPVTVRLGLFFNSFTLLLKGHRL